MLTKRANILFSEDMWKMLEFLAREKGQSVGELVRQTIENCLSTEDQLAQQKKAIQKIREIQKTLPKFRKIDYKGLINAGRHI